VVSTVHNSLFDYEISPFRRWLYVLAERLTSPLADRIVAVSSHITRDLIHRYGISPEQVVTIRNGIEADSFVPARSPSDVLKELNVNNQDRRIGLAARMTPQKGHLVLLQALRLISQRFSNLRCLLIGDGPLRPSLERYAGELGVAGQCVFTGIRSDIADLLSVVEVVVLPSHSEGLPFVLLEAMALAKPVVATRVGGNPEVVEDGKTGLLVPPADPKAMAEAIAFLLDHPDEAACMGKRGRERVVECFGLDRMVKALEQLYLELLDRAGVRSDKDNEGRPYGSCRDGRDRSSR
jgi:glycosyltransferase involved in cell wall biosynthesis